MRHVSRTDRVALDWLFNSINVDPQIQINYVDTRDQLADILTKGTFTRDEWHHLLRLLNIMSNSASSCSHVSNKIDDPLVMSKRQMQNKQQGAECDRVAAKSRLARNLVDLIFNRCCTMPSLTSFLQSPVNPRASCSTLGSLSTGRSVAMNSNASNASVLKSGTEIQTRTWAQGDLLRDLKSEPPPEIWSLTTLLFRHTMLRKWKKV